MKWQTGFGWTITALCILMSSVGEARESLCADALAGLARIMSPASSPLNAELTYEPLTAPEVAYSYEVKEDRHELMELAVISRSRDPVLQSLIEEVQGLGAEVRLLKLRVTRADGTFASWLSDSPYFWVNRDPKSPSFLKRIVAIDPTQPRVLASLAHEIQHLRLWTESYETARAFGLDEVAAVEQAWAYVRTPEATLEGERRAVGAEMRMERLYPENPFNRPYEFPAPTDFRDPGYVARITYPEYQVVRLLLSDGSPLTDKYLREWIERAEELRAQALEALSPDDSRRDYWEKISLLALMLGQYGHLRLEGDKTLEAFKVAVARLRP